MKLKGIVLAGGKSSRFGEDKALALVDGSFMIQRAVNLLTELHLDPCVITNASRDYSFLNCKIERDLVSEKGPLGGIYTAFCKFEGVPLVILTCDMPIVSREALHTLKEEHASERKATLFQGEGGNPEPFPGIYEPCLKLLARDCVRTNILSMQQFIQKIPEKKFLSLFPDQDIFVNVNSKRDFQGILRKKDRITWGKESKKSIRLW